MGSTEVVEKTEEELRKEIDELQRQRREITERLRDPRGIRRGGSLGAGPRNFASNGARQRGFVRSAERNDEDQPPAKRRLSSAVVKVEDGEITGDGSEAAKDLRKKDLAVEDGGTGDNANATPAEKKSSDWSRGVGSQRPSKMDFEPVEHVPRVLPKNEDPSLVSRNKRMLGQLLGTLERFRKEDAQLSGTEAYMRRSDSLKRAEQRAREESERLRLQERELIAEKRKRDLTLRARIAAKAEEKKLELLFLQWSEHHKKLGNFIRILKYLNDAKNPALQEFRTKAEPPIYYLFAKPMDENAALLEQQKEQIFEEWKASRREELSEYQKQIAEWYIGNVDKELERWQNGRRGRKANNDMANLQETMDKELETHQLEHGRKTRKIPGGSNEDEDDAEDINVGEDDMMDDYLDVDVNGNRVDGTAKTETGIGSPQEDQKEG